MIPVRLTSAAQGDIADALDWYDQHAPGIGSRFLGEFEALVLRLGENPRQFPQTYRELRRAGFRHFPYGLFFRLNSAEVEIIACFHASRAPRRWQGRV